MKDRLADVREIRNRYDKGQAEKAVIDAKLQADRARLEELESKIDAAALEGDVWEFKKLRTDIKDLREDIRLSEVEARAWDKTIDLDRCREVWGPYSADAEAHIKELWDDMEPIREALHEKLMEIADTYNEIYCARETLLRAAGCWDPTRSRHLMQLPFFSELHWTTLKAETDYLKHSDTITKKELSQIGEMCLTHQAQHDAL